MKISLPKPVPKQTIVDCVVFKMPVDRELQFPAMSTMQTYVNTYDRKTEISDVSRGMAAWELKYDLIIPEVDWKFFMDAGLVLPKTRTRDLVPDMLVDLTEEKLLPFMDSGRHACQACRIMSGVEALPYPQIKQVQWRYVDRKWALLDDPRNERFAVDYPFVRMAPEELLLVGGDEITGVVGFASWGTYLAASMGLPVVELVPSDRPRYWLAKITNKAYRIVDSDDPEEWKFLVPRAMASAEKELDLLMRAAKQAESRRQFGSRIGDAQ